MNEHNIKIKSSNTISELKQVLHTKVKIGCTRLDYKNGMPPSPNGRI